MPSRVGHSRSLGERLASNPWLIAIGVIASVFGIASFMTGKNLPDFTHKAVASPGASTSVTAPSSARSSPNTSAKSAPSKSGASSARIKPDYSNRSSPAAPASPAWHGLTAPSAAEIKSCIQQRGIDTNLADYGLNDSNLGNSATLRIKVDTSGNTYRLIAADSACQPVTLVTVGPGQSATVHLYFGAMWDFEPPGSNWAPGGPSPLGPDRLTTFEFWDHATVTVSAP
jgi:hypothetical protein